MKLKQKLRMILASFVLFISSPVLAEDSDRLLGNWGGTIDWLEKNGITPEIIATNEIVGNAKGGIQRTTKFAGAYDFSLEIDTEKAIGHEGGTLFFYGLATAGSSPNSIVGDLQVTSNIDVGRNALVYQAWYNQEFADTGISALVGMHDINSEMNALEYAGALFNSSFGTPLDYSQVGPSIYPLTTLGALIRVKGDNLYLLNGVYDGVPSDPNKTKGTHIKFDSGDGIFWGSEFGYVEGAADEADYTKVGIIQKISKIQLAMIKILIQDSTVLQNINYSLRRMMLRKD